MVVHSGTRNPPAWWPQRIVSGGQTGVDRAALDWAISVGIPHGGWCPRGRIAEDGVIPHQYQLIETESAGYRQRRRWNIRDSDATLVLTVGSAEGGTLATIRDAEFLAKPSLLLHLEADTLRNASHLRNWLASSRCRTLNVAGPREQGAWYRGDDGLVPRQFGCHRVASFRGRQVSERVSQEMLALARSAYMQVEGDAFDALVSDGRAGIREWISQGGYLDHSPAGTRCLSVAYLRPDECRVGSSRLIIAKAETGEILFSGYDVSE